MILLLINGRTSALLCWSCALVQFIVSHVLINVLTSTDLTHCAYRKECKIDVDIDRVRVACKSAQSFWLNVCCIVKLRTLNKMKGTLVLCVLRSKAINLHKVQKQHSPKPSIIFYSKGALTRLP